MDLNDSKVEQLLKQKGLRPTIARRQILTLLFEHANHLSADEILEMLRSDGYKVGAATIYQNLARLVGAGLVTRFTGVDGLVRFDSNLAPHHHLICIKCGRVEDVSNDTIGPSDRHLSSRYSGKSQAGWKIDSVQLELKGICPMCRKRK